MHPIPHYEPTADELRREWCGEGVRRAIPHAIDVELQHARDMREIERQASRRFELRHKKV